jgi:hypothetical protein
MTPRVSFIQLAFADTGAGSERPNPTELHRDRPKKPPRNWVVEPSQIARRKT